MTDQLERRPMLDLRAVTGDRDVIEGYVAKFNKLATFQGLREKILPGAFKRTLEEAKRGLRDIVALKDHDSSKVLGRLSRGTLELIEDDEGLFARIYPPKSTLGTDTLEEVRSGHINGGSFGFVSQGSDVDVTAGVRRLKDLNFEEITVTGMPIYRDTHIAVAKRALANVDQVRSLTDKEIMTPKEMEEVIADQEKLNKQVTQLLWDMEVRALRRQFLRRVNN